MTVRATLLGLALMVGAGAGLAQAAAPGLQACYDECKRAKLSDTNRASCRLDCDADAASDPELIRAQIGEQVRTQAKARTNPGAEATPAAPGQGPGCKAGCDADRTLSVDDRATCKLECDLDPDSPVNRGAPANGTTTTTPGAPPPRGSSPLTFQLSGPPPSPEVQAGFIARCDATCQQGPYKLSATDFATCKLDCRTMASVLDVAGGWVPRVWRQPAAGQGQPAAVQPVQPAKVAAATTPPGSSTPARTTTPRTSATDSSAVAACAEQLTSCNDRCSGAVQRCERGCGKKHLIETDRETCKLTCETDSEVCRGDCLAANATCVNSKQARPQR